MPPTRVLVSNDDGIDAPGLQALVHGLVSCPDYDVRVGAPKEERSGSSHAFCSLITATVYTEGKTGLPEHVPAYAVSGYPADAVRLAFATDVFEDGWKPEVVVAGVNRGLNAGKYLVMSGTLGAAREGAMHGVKAMAVSLHAAIGRHKAKKEDFEAAVEDLMPVLNWFKEERNWPSNVFLNINFPHPSAFPTGKEEKGLIVVPQGQSVYSFAVDGRREEKEEKEKTFTYRYRFLMEMDPKGTIDSDDLAAITENYTTLTAIPIGVQDDVQGAMSLLHSWRQTHRHPRLHWSAPC